MAVTGALRLPGELALARFPADAREQLRAWDAADEYLLRYLSDGSGGVPGFSPPVDLTGRVVVFGDRWGALTTALAVAGVHVTQISDSFLSQQATLANVTGNGGSHRDLELLSTVDDFSGPLDTLLIRVPKSLALLEGQLRRLVPVIGPLRETGTRIIGTGMVTEVHTSTLQAFERILGSTRTSLAVRKARLIFCETDPTLP
ncbi:MAG: 50S rRNA methyltransferase, partial [Catenulispora sp.]